MSQEGADSESPTEEILTYTVDSVNYPCNVPSAEENIKPTKPKKKRKMYTKSVKKQRDIKCLPLKTLVYCKPYYRHQVRSLFKLMNATCKLENRVLRSACDNVPINQQNEGNCSPYFSILNRRFQTLANAQ
ncbi:uncharacterized protein LOC128717965 [Anopheles marshallii]|uniref:uncharacterized protein LOC128717965 n=1 Tax=Anopheles marshallii TaxID=1521116 RepID=UPI00237B8BE3|nr:uncharacterized protein LOC128717965 [Anopheles marshallii]